MKSTEAHYLLGLATGLLMRISREAPLTDRTRADVDQLIQMVSVAHQESRNQEAAGDEETDAE